MAVAPITPNQYYFTGEWLHLRPLPTLSLDFLTVWQLVKIVFGPNRGRSATLFDDSGEVWSARVVSFSGHQL
jgi:hypothetical protein